MQVDNLNNIGTAAVRSTEVAVRCRMLNILLGNMTFPNLQLLQTLGDLDWAKHVSPTATALLMHSVLTCGSCRVLAWG